MNIVAVVVVVLVLLAVGVAVIVVIITVALVEKVIATNIPRNLHLKVIYWAYFCHAAMQ